ncbi:MAG: transketolase [Lentimicrobium sp.]|nr:transketolase [Lentimicrobium sp.]
MQKVTDYSDLTRISYSIRKSIVKSLATAGSGDTGSSLGLADVFTSLYFNHMSHNPAIPAWEERDRLILSFCDAAPVIYATLAHAGYFDLKQLYTPGKPVSRLQVHPALNKNLPGIETSTGSPGQGLSMAVRIAIAAKMDKKSIRIYSVHCDGEMQEGQLWEAAMAASHHKLDNLTAIIDYNGLQTDAKTTDVLNIEPLVFKWQAFGWNVVECNGHDFRQILNSLEKVNEITGKPGVIIAKTTMGKGIKTIENNHLWQGRAPTHEEATEFLCQLDESLILAIEEIAKSGF